MKILYAVQATGNGHISRAMELLPYLQQYGTVDIFLSGDNSHLQLDAPVKYRSKGISLFYNCHGGLDYWKILRELRLFRVSNEIRDLPVEKYDLVLNDFDYITAAACSRKKIPSIHFGHQASFQSPLCPRPAHRSLMGEWLLKNYVKAPQHVGLHFKSYADFIFPAIVKKAILSAEPTDMGYITVYLPAFCEQQLAAMLHPLIEFQFRVFSRECIQTRKAGNITFLPVNKALFNQGLIHCTGIITGAGFETPAEALHLGKRIMAIPIRGQYEQLCNAAALQTLGVTCLPSIDQHFQRHFHNWIEKPAAARIDYSHAVEESIHHILTLAESRYTLTTG